MSSDPFTPPVNSAAADASSRSALNRRDRSMLERSFRRLGIGEYRILRSGEWPLDFSIKDAQRRSLRDVPRPRTVRRVTPREGTGSKCAGCHPVRTARRVQLGVEAVRRTGQGACTKPFEAEGET